MYSNQLNIISNLYQKDLLSQIKTDDAAVSMCERTRKNIKKGYYCDEVLSNDGNFKAYLKYKGEIKYMFSMPLELYGEYYKKYIRIDILKTILKK